MKDVNEHFDWIVEQRGMDTSKAKFKIYSDAVGGSCMVMASVIDEHQNPEVMDTSVEQPGNRLSGGEKCLGAGLCGEHPRASPQNQPKP